MKIKIPNIALIITLLSALLLSSCVSSKKVDYLQDMTTQSQIELENQFEAVIRPYDELDIIVSSYDQELAKPFNISMNQYGTGSGQRNNSYLVDVNGNIQFPVLGEIYVANMTRLQLQEAIATRLKADKYISDPFVQVRFHNFKIFFLGADGGKAITISNERCTFLEALALSGDLSVYTRRDKIAVMREIDGKMVVRYLDPRSSKVFNDPFFLLRQNDFIITQSVNTSTIRNEVNYWLTWVSTGISIASLLATIFLYGAINK